MPHCLTVEYVHKETALGELHQIAWHRFNVIVGVISDNQARFVAILFYFTILAPFGIIARLTSDPLHIKAPAQWLKREAIPTDIDAAKLQG